MTVPEVQGWCSTVIDPRLSSWQTIWPPSNHLSQVSLHHQSRNIQNPHIYSLVHHKHLENQQETTQSTTKSDQKPTMSPWVLIVIFLSHLKTPRCWSPTRPTPPFARSPRSHHRPRKSIFRGMILGHTFQNKRVKKKTKKMFWSIFPYNNRDFLWYPFLLTATCSKRHTYICIPCIYTNKSTIKDMCQFDNGIWRLDLGAPDRRQEEFGLEALLGLPTDIFAHEPSMSSSLR